MHRGARMQRAVTTLRPLTVADLPAIHDISRGVYDGVDYLPGRIRSWLDDESVHTIGLEQGGMLLGVHTAHLLENESTALLQGLRVHSSRRCNGIGSVLAAAIMTHVRQYAPTVQRFLTCLESTNTHQAKMRADWNELFSSAYLCAELTNNVLSRPHVYERLSAEPATSTAADSDSLRSILINDRPDFLPLTGIRATQPFPLTPHGVEKSAQRGDTWLVRGNPHVVSVSSGSFYSIPNSSSVGSYMWSSEIYSDSPKEIDWHLIEQLKQGFRHVNGEPFAFECHVPREFAARAQESLRSLCNVDRLKREGFNIIVKEKVVA